MCGVAGYWSYHKTDAVEAQRIAEKMALTLAHRGPDSQGVWVDESKGVSIAHRRLSVVDTSPAGSQPMVSRSGRYVLSYNGEIYNAQKIRTSHEAVRHAVWKGHSDTEVLLELIDRIGIEAAVLHLQGMFAFALWDRHESELWLARDRFGEKPIYYGWLDSTLAFSSELKALRAHPGFKAQIDPGALRAYFKFGYVPSPASIYKDVFKLNPGTLVRFKTPKQGLEQIRPYWSAGEVAREAQDSTAIPGYAEALDHLGITLGGILESSTVSDVPLGVLLSGGVDSSLIAALAQSVSTKPIKTFTIGNLQGGYDESVHARKVASYLGTEHIEHCVSPKDTLDILPDLQTIYDEPFSDSSQIPSVLISRLVRRKVTVALTGDGGDELFGGYNRHIHARRLSNIVRHVPLVLRKQLPELIRLVGTERLNTWLSIFSASSPKQISGSRAGDKIQKLAQLLSSQNVYRLSDEIQSIWTEVDDLMANSAFTSPQPACKYSDLDFTAQLMLGDTQRYLPDDILVKMDRASMSAGLETRAPFLDPNLYRFAWSLPEDYKIHKGQGKRILRDLLYRHIPRDLVDRPKQGFAIPVGAWLRSELREWAEELLSPFELRKHGFLDVKHVRACWLEHLSGRQNHDAKLWSILMFQSWYVEHHE